MNLIFGFVFLFAIAFFVWHYFFSIYETRVILSPLKPAYEINDSIEISVEPLNSFGIKSPFRKISSQVNVLQGKSIAEIKKENENKFLLIAKNKGKLVLEISNKFSLLNELVKIKVDEN